MAYLLDVNLSIRCPWKFRYFESYKFALENSSRTETNRLLVGNARADRCCCLPVTLVPMTSNIGISSGKSLKSEISPNLRCCKSLIFCLFLWSAALSSAKKAAEHLRNKSQNCIKYKRFLLKLGCSCVSTRAKRFVKQGNYFSEKLLRNHARPKD